MKSFPISETDEQTAVADFLAGFLGGHATGFHIPNERSSAWERIQATKAGALWGMTDFVVIDAGRAICFELKQRGWRHKKLYLRTGKLTVHEQRQLDVHCRLRLAGCPVEICETLNEVVWFLQQQGVPLRKTDVGATPIPAVERGGRLTLAEMYQDLPNDGLEDMLDAEAGGALVAKAERGR